ncbi:hypothetical protein AB0M91_04645 [Micromonospora rifamycinica]|uniref:hypothetical protein n=1 Tax=Micromonospora rifamycinica TaxID=291594 RepID=UPI003425F2A2
MTTTIERTYARKVSQIERGYLNAASQGTQQLIQTVVEGVGEIDPVAVREAIRIATAASPGLAVVRRGPVWRAGGPLPAVVVHPAGSGLPAGALGSDIDVVRGPVCEVHLVPGPVTRLVVRVSHVVTDGRGLQQWLADVFRVLRGEEPVGAPAVVDDTHFRAAAGTVPPAPAPARVAGFPAILGAGPSGPTPLWVRRTVPGSPSGVTARVAAAISRHLRGDAGRLIVPVDLRRHDRTVRSTANLSAQLLLDLRRGDDWRRVHRELLGAMLRKREVARLAGDFRRSNPFANTLAEAQEHTDDRFPCTAIVSDHGPVHLERYHAPGFRPVRFYTLPMLVPYAEMFVSSCQTGDGTELTLSCRDRIGAREAAEAILDDAAGLLTEVS